jgi:hypothetical protein
MTATLERPPPKPAAEPRQAIADLTCAGGCGVGARLVVFLAGEQEIRSETGILIRPGRSLQGWCLACAARAGWPWLEAEHRKRGHAEKHD